MPNNIASGQPSVLVVDDDEALRVLFVALLARQGFRVECVNDGAAALQSLERSAYSVLILDLMMPGTNGFDVLERLSATQPAMLRRTIVATGVSSRELAKIDDASVFAVLRKPFDIDSLVTKVRECADQDEGDEKLDGSVRKLERVLPALRQTLKSSAVATHELMLRNELRRVVAEVARLLFAVACGEANTERAARWQHAGQHAAQLAYGRTLYKTRS